MVLDTKSKNYSIIVKIILILLSVSMFAGAVCCAERVVSTAIAYDVGFEDFNGKSLNREVGQSVQLNTLVFRDIAYMDNGIFFENSDAIRKELSSKRDDFVNAALSAYKSNRSEYDRAVRYDEEEFGEFFTYDYLIEYHSNEYYFDFTIHVYESDGIDFGTTSDEDAEAKFNIIFDEFINTNNFSNYVYDLYPSEATADLCFVVKDTKNHLTFSNVDDFDEEILKEREFAFIVKNGNVVYSNGFNPIFEDESNTFRKDLEYYAYVEPDNTCYNDYTAAIDSANKCRGINLLSNTIAAGVMALLSLVFAVIGFAICGKKDKNGKIKRALIDKVPTDLHLALTVGAQIGLGFLFAFVYDTILNFAYPFERYLYFAVYGIAALIWALLMEFLTSFIRVCRSEKKVYQNTLLYLIIKYIIIKPCGFLFRNLKSLFAYQPANFKKSLRAIIIGYGILNALFLFLFFLCVMINAPGGFGFLFLLSVGINIALFVFIVRYIKTLDTIITAAHFRQPPQVDYNKLPNSLKTLVNSLNYTRTELQNAVDKAVRDERMRTELITNVSHDLKTPLTSIITYVDLLKNCDIENEDAKEYIAVLDEKGSRLKRLIDDLIEASKITSGVINVESINLNLSELATQAVVEHQQEFADNGLTLVFKGDEKNIGAFADGKKTYRIIENLISNARKYSLRGTRVYADVYETQNFSIFEIKNTSAEALNISPDELKQRFVRGDKSRANEGNGLGLSIAEELCKAQGGHLNITIDGDLFKVQVMLPKTK